MRRATHLNDKGISDFSDNCRLSSFGEMKKAAYAKADGYHSEYLMNIEDPRKGVMLGIGLNYIRFAIEEPHLFRFLFQSISVLALRGRFIGCFCGGAHCRRQHRSCAL